MPYTPPSPSPATSPAASRSGSISLPDTRSPATTMSNMKSGNLPRSTTYLYKNRRTPPITSPHSPSVNSQYLPSRPLVQHRHSDSNGSVHRPPAPVDNGMSIPAGAIISPPDSSQNSSDEEEAAKGDGNTAVRGRRRDLGNLELQLKEAIKNIPQRREPSPDSANPKSPSSTDPESKGRRLHSRSASETMLAYGISGGSGSGSEDDDEGYRIAPPMVRKKSGEVVKSSLKTPNRSRPSSMPSTPTFPKAVHFDSHIEHVRHFLHSEKPSAVSAGSSPVESYDGETEFPFSGEDSFRSREPPFEWEISLPNFPKDSDSRKHKPVRVERVVLSTDKKNLIGTVAVSNIAFQKSVVVRFTLDYWETVSEVSAEFNNDVRKKQREEGVDRFSFNIKLIDQANLENKLLFFCVRYTSGGQEFWDNNNSINFQVEFKKKAKPQNGKNGSARPLPRSSKPSSSRPRTLPNNFDDDLESYEDAGIFEKLKNAELPEPKSLNLTGTTESLARRANPSGNAFGNRYDFGASLNAAIQAAEAVPGKKMRRRTINFDDVDSPYFKSASPPVPAPEEPKVQVVPALKPSSPTSSLPRPSRSAVKDTAPLDSPPASGAGSPTRGYKPAPFTGGKPSIESSSYRELIDNYCFFGSSKASPQLSQGAEIPDKMHNPTNLNPALYSGAIFATDVGSGSPLPETAISPRYVSSPPHNSPPSSLKSSGNASPIPANYAGFHHRRRPSGAFKFTQAPTAIC
ncbi:Carbohydrate-Binding Module Family 21 protein [Tuber magnatum]|uniref:Carbohydrate-Binding Module Family 21 protein n=1 Tax=Tuber magnatum TaxID=42249 RepID=A0A317SSW8_9PEZI|nr:Carbohydrate-Binding Module Family 21 protein [Tuber magnatum]